MVEYNLAKVGVAGSNPVFRSKSYAPVAQLDRASDYGSEGYGFDSFRARHIYNDAIKPRYKRGVAQLGRALGLGPRGRRFKSCLPDHLIIGHCGYGGIPKSG